MKLLNPMGQLKARVSSGFGMRRGVMHAAIDFAAPRGTPVYASLDGKVIKTAALNGVGKPDGYGEWHDVTLDNGLRQRVYDGGFDVELEHPNGHWTRYSHLSECFVEVGETVKAGQLIGKVGTAGTGAHLHFELKRCKGYYSGRGKDLGVNPLKPNIFTRNLLAVEL